MLCFWLVDMSHGKLQKKSVRLFYWEFHCLTHWGVKNPVNFVLEKQVKWIPFNVNWLRMLWRAYAYSPCICVHTSCMMQHSSLKSHFALGWFTTTEFQATVIWRTYSATEYGSTKLYSLTGTVVEDTAPVACKRAHTGHCTCIPSNCKVLAACWTLSLNSCLHMINPSETDQHLLGLFLMVVRTLHLHPQERRMLGTAHLTVAFAMHLVQVGSFRCDLEPAHSRNKLLA